MNEEEQQQPNWNIINSRPSNDWGSSSSEDDGGRSSPASGRSMLH